MRETLFDAAYYELIMIILGWALDPAFPKKIYNMRKNGEIVFPVLRKRIKGHKRPRIPPGVETAFCFCKAQQPSVLKGRQ
jgi:hypothetical protein